MREAAARKQVSWHCIEVAGLRVEVVRKDIQNLHLAVYPPEGRVRIAAPLRMEDDAIRLAIVDRLAWIRRHQAAFGRQARQSQREMVTGESHYVWGQRRRLHVFPHDAPPRILLRGRSSLDLYVRSSADREAREAALTAWYRAQLKQRIPELIAAWEPALGVHVEQWQVRRMRTRWGSCNAEAGRILINLELAKKAPECLEYIVVHEMVHLLERRHSARFQALMDHHLPLWRQHRTLLNAAPLAHETWAY